MERRRRQRPRRPHDRRLRSALRDPLVALDDRDGFAASLVIVERHDRSVDREFKTVAVPLFAGRGRKRRKTRTRRRLRNVNRVSSPVCEAMAALGHVLRVRILLKALQGPATYRAFQRLTKLKPGPLYHHLKQLRLAALLTVKERNLYVISPKGTKLALAALLIRPLLGRPRTE